MCSGLVPLHNACSYGHYEVTQLLIEVLEWCSVCFFRLISGLFLPGVDIGVNANLELVDKFSNLGDMLSVDGDADASVETRIWIAWNKFSHLVLLLINKDISLIVRGRLYNSYVQSSMLHGSETCPVRKENEGHFSRQRWEWSDGCVALSCKKEFQSSLIYFLHLLRSTASLLISLCAW